MADKTVGLDVLPSGAGGLQIKYHDNGDGTYSEQVYTAGGGGGGGAVTLAAGSVVPGAYLSGALADGAVATIGAKADAANTDSTSAWSLVSLLKGVWAAITAGVKLVDSAGTNKATIKAANTGAVASTDTSLVVQNMLGTLAQGSVTLSGSTTTGAILTGVAAQAVQTELSSVSLAAAGPSQTAVVTPSNGVAAQFSLNVTAFTAGSSTGMDAQLQYSIDGQSNWIDAWHFDRVTATGAQQTPPLAIGPYPRRINFTNNTGAATTCTASLITSRMYVPAPPAYKFIDRTAALITNPAAGATGATFRIFGAKSVTAAITVGAATTPGQYTIQISADGVNWGNAQNAAGTAASVTAVATSTASVTAVNVTGTYVRLIQTASSVSQTGTQATITALG